MQFDFYSELNRNTVKAVTGNTAFFINPVDSHPPFISNSFTGLPITGANYFNLMLANNANRTRHTEYVKMNEALATQPEWFASIPPETRPRGILYQDENPSNQPRYSFVMPTAELNQAVYRDKPENIMPRENYVPFQTHETKMNDFGNFVKEQCTNAINASFTNTAFKSDIPENELSRFKTMLNNEIAVNPGFMAEVTNQAHREVMDLHYLPFNRKNFIEKARNENSREFQQLNSAITEHVEGMYTSKKPSFNPEFNELSKPLVNAIKNIHLNNPNPQTAVNREITAFVKEKVRQERPAEILVDTCAGTHIEKARKAERIGKMVIKGAALAGALVTSNFPVAIGIASSMVSDIVSWRKTPKDIPHQHIVINGCEIKGNEYQKILNFDNAPYSLTGKGKISHRDYEIAHQAERAILNANPAINKDEYRQDMTRHQVINFYETARKKMDSDSPQDFMKVADNIAASQGLKGDNSLKSSRNNPRAFFAGLNQVIRDNPQVLEQAVSQAKTVKNTVSQVIAMSRR